jgi:hypothetical protein
MLPHSFVTGFSDIVELKRRKGGADGLEWLMGRNENTSQE